MEWERIQDIRNTYISLVGVGFGEGLGKFASIISLKLLFPTFLASCNINRTQHSKLFAPGLKGFYYLLFRFLSRYFPPPGSEYKPSIHLVNTYLLSTCHVPGFREREIQR